MAQTTSTEMYDVATNLQTQMLDIHKAGCKDVVKAKRKGMDVDMVPRNEIDDWVETVFGEVEEIENPSDFQNFLPCAR